MCKPHHAAKRLLFERSTGTEWFNSLWILRERLIINMFVPYNIQKVVVKLYLLFNFPDYSTRVTCCNTIIGNWLSNYATGPDSCVIADCYSRQYNWPSSNPYIITNCNRSSIWFPKLTIFRQPFLRIHRMSNCIDMYSGPMPLLLPIDIRLPSPKRYSSYLSPHCF